MRLGDPIMFLPPGGLGGEEDWPLSAEFRGSRVCAPTFLSSSLKDTDDDAMTKIRQKSFLQFKFIRSSQKKGSKRKQLRANNNVDVIVASIIWAC
jgi:hypothetical protein